MRLKTRVSDLTERVRALEQLMDLETRAITRGGMNKWDRGLDVPTLNGKIEAILESLGADGVYIVRKQESVKLKKGDK